MDPAKVLRTKRIRVAQENVVKTAGKENGIHIRTRPENVKDIYSDDIGSEALVVAYVEHIYGYLHEREVISSLRYSIVLLEFSTYY